LNTQAISSSLLKSLNFSNIFELLEKITLQDA